MQYKYCVRYFRATNFWRGRTFKSCKASSWYLGRNLLLTFPKYNYIINSLRIYKIYIQWNVNKIRRLIRRYKTKVQLRLKSLLFFLKWYNEVIKINSPLLAPSGPLKIVHSSIVPKGANNCLTSSSVCCLLSIPTNSFLSV